MIYCNVLRRYWKLHNAVPGNPSPLLPPLPTASSAAPVRTRMAGAPPHVVLAEDAKKGSQYCQRVRFVARAAHRHCFLRFVLLSRRFVACKRMPTAVMSSLLLLLLLWFLLLVCCLRYCCYCSCHWCCYCFCYSYSYCYCSCCYSYSYSYSYWYCCCCCCSCCCFRHRCRCAPIALRLQHLVRDVTSPPPLPLRSQVNGTYDPSKAHH